MVRLVSCLRGKGTGTGTGTGARFLLCCFVGRVRFRLLVPSSVQTAQTDALAVGQGWAQVWMCAGAPARCFLVIILNRESGITLRRERWPMTLVW
jgi:hypothetical protein